MKSVKGQGLAYIDHEFCPVDQAKISVFDPGFSRSDVVYDVTSTWKGYFFRLDEHVERFVRSCEGVRLICPLTPAAIKRIVARCVVDGGVGEGAYVSMALTRGRFDKDGVATRDISQAVPNFIAYAVPFIWISSPEEQSRGMSMIIAKTPRIPDAAVDMRFKNYHWGDLIRAKFEALDAGAEAAVLLSTEGFVAEGVGYNVFFVRSGRLFTPARNCLEGLTRQSVMDLARELGLSAQMGNYVADELRQADEIFVTSTAGGIMPVSRLDGRNVGGGIPGPVTMKLKELFWQRRAAGWLGTSIDEPLREA